jgi:2-octaprenyl-6-methoxyphenol hydroxylase
MSVALPRVDVAIAGASFAGLALAVALAKAGEGEVSIVVLDRVAAATAAPDDPRAVAISQASKRMLDLIGVWPSIEADAQPVLRIEISDSPLEAGVRPVLLAWDNTLDGEPASFIVPNGVLTQALTEAADRAKGIQVLNDVGVVGLRADDFAVALTDKAGMSLTTARVAVAADGRGSALRAAAGIKVVGWDYRQLGIITRVAHERPHEGRAVQHFLPGGPFAMLPLKGDRSCITWSEDEVVARRVMALDDVAFLAELETRLGGRLGSLTLDGGRLSFPLGMHLARSYVARRLALVGDAAHSVHPLAGQGLNLALRDAAALAECIIEGMRAGLDAGDATILERYERWRRFDSWLSAATFDGLNRLFRGDVALVRSAREFGLQAVDRLGWLKGLLMREASGVTGELPRLLKGEPI